MRAAKEERWFTRAGQARDAEQEQEKKMTQEDKGAGTFKVFRTRSGRRRRRRRTTTGQTSE